MPSDQAGTLATPGAGSRRPRPARRPLAVEQRAEPAVPELEAGAGDHRQVDVHRRLRDALVSMSRTSWPAPRGCARGPVGAEDDRVLRLLGSRRAPRGRVPGGRPPPGSRPLAGLHDAVEARRDVEPVGERRCRVSLLCSAIAGPTSPSSTNGGIGASPRRPGRRPGHRGALVDDPGDLAHEPRRAGG
jgi:hypothetical protein